jgi:hypothetical protein
MNHHEIQAGCFGTLFTRKTRSLMPTSKLDRPSREVARSANRNIDDSPEKVGNMTVWFPWY